MDGLKEGWCCMNDSQLGRDTFCLLVFLRLLTDCSFVKCVRYEEWTLNRKLQIKRLLCYIGVS